jgi:hypothetical protein
MPKKKSPILAAFLAFILGPLGLLYIGWRYALLSFIMLFLFVIPITLFNLVIPPFTSIFLLGSAEVASLSRPSCAGSSRAPICGR